MQTQPDAAGAQGGSHQESLPDKLLVYIACACWRMHMQGLTRTPCSHCAGPHRPLCRVHLEWTPLCSCVGPADPAAGSSRGPTLLSRQRMWHRLLTEFFALHLKLQASVSWNRFLPTAAQWSILQCHLQGLYSRATAHDLEAAIPVLQPFVPFSWLPCTGAGPAHYAAGSP